MFARTRSGFYEILKTLIEARQAPASIEQIMLAACPSWVRRGVDIEGHGVALAAPGRTRLITRAVIKFDGHKVIFGMNALLHLTLNAPATKGAYKRWGPLVQAAPKSLRIKNSLDISALLNGVRPIPSGK